MNSVLDSPVNNDVMIEENEVSDSSWLIFKCILYVFLAFIILLICRKIYLMMNYVDLKFSHNNLWVFVHLDNDNRVWMRIDKSYINPTMIPCSPNSIDYELLCNGIKTKLSVDVYESRIISLVKDNITSIKPINSRYDLSGIVELKEIFTEIINNNKRKMNK